MRKHIKRDDGIPRAGKTISLVVTRVVEARNTAAASEPARTGKLNYQSKPKKAANAAKALPPGPQRIERKTYATGRFIGDGEKLTAFVWLDEDTAPEGDAAND